MLIAFFVVIYLFWWAVGAIGGSLLASLGTVGTAIKVIGSVYSGIVVLGAIAEIAYAFSTGVWIRYQSGGLYESNMLARAIYDWIYDVDGTVARIVVMGFVQGNMPYDFTKFEWYGEEYS